MEYLIIKNLHHLELGQNHQQEILQTSTCGEAVAVVEVTPTTTVVVEEVDMPSTKSQ